MSATIKLKNFEYSAIANNTVESNRMCQHGSFDTPNGFVFVLSVSDKSSDDSLSFCSIIHERVQYYLENEVLDDPREAVASAMVYINGFLFEQRRKNPDVGDPRAGLLCVLIKDQKVYYGWTGETAMMLYTGRKTVALTRAGVADREWREGSPVHYGSLGLSREFEPKVCSTPLVPVDLDAILVTAGAGWSSLKEHTVVDILADSMPANTKVQKLLKLATGAQPNSCSAALLVSFYNMGQMKRSFAEAKATVAEGADKVAEVMSLKGRLWKWRYLIILLSVLLASYMVYDLFLFNPARPVSDYPADTLQVQAPEPSGQAAQVEEEAEAEVPVQPQAEAERPTSVRPAQLPADVRYTVRTGDTWGAIYAQFEVCSWFIRNHPPNRDKFDGRGNPRVNAVLLIPVKFSGNERLNPNFFREFSVEHVGNACQNANQAFVERFMARVNQSN